MSYLFTKLTISLFLAKYVCFSLAAKASAVNLLNSGVVIYLSRFWSIIFFPPSLIFCDIVRFFLTKLLTLGILFLLPVRPLVAAKLVILGISLLAWFALALRVVLVAKLVMSGISSSMFFILSLYASFLTTSFFLNHLIYLSQQEQVLIY